MQLKSDNNSIKLFFIEGQKNNVNFTQCPKTFLVVHIASQLSQGVNKPIKF